jgi:hypothetical protein
VTAPRALDRIMGALTGPVGEDWAPLAVGWASVDLERAASELAAELGIAVAAFLPAADSVVLGARCVIAHGVLADGQPLAILEPRTEGRLAALLARRGEGPAATWARSAASTAGGRTGTASPGPFGFERLASGWPAHGVYRLLIEDGPGTIQP